MTDFSRFQYLTREMNWGDPDKISTDLLFRLDAYCQYMGHGVHVDCGTQGEHKAQVHAAGLAVDLIPLTLINGAMSLLDCFIAATRFGFGGIGIYPDWEYNNVKTGGLHFDVRPARMTALWLGVKDVSNEQIYIPLTEDNLKKYGGIK